jgi:luciferase family oxidoreductase group 1
MLPNHAPLLVAEQFGTLDALHPGRIDLGLGRAPGTDRLTVQALRRDPYTAADSFPQDVLELQSYFQAPQPGQRVSAIPAVGRPVPFWILGSSTYGAQVAAALGLPYSFASHFAPRSLMEALHIYRTRFEPSAQLSAPYVMLGVHVFSADTHSQAALLATTVQQMFANLHRGTPRKLQPPEQHFIDGLDAAARTGVQQSMQYACVGTLEEVNKQLGDFIAATGADELLIAAPTYDFKARLRSYEIAAQSHCMLSC